MFRLDPLNHRIQLDTEHALDLAGAIGEGGIVRAGDGDAHLSDAARQCATGLGDLRREIGGENVARSGEGRGGEEGRFRGAPDHLKKKKKKNWIGVYVARNRWIERPTHNWHIPSVRLTDVMISTLLFYSVVVCFNMTDLVVELVEDC